MKKYVLITGASSGLGCEFAKQLAKLGFSLLLVARREEKLMNLIEELSADHKDLEFLYLPIDLSKPSAIDLIFNKIIDKKLNLVGLINNAGLGERGEFSNNKIASHLNVLQVNINALVELTYAAIPFLKVNPQPFIINLASTAAFQAGPNLAIYYASKAFVLSFSEALHEELKPLNIKVSALCPGATNTEFASVAGMSDSLVFKLRVMEAEPVIKYSLNNRDKAIVIPGVVNKFGVFLAKIAPRSLSRKIAYLIQK